jgi:hypothetical protein
MILLPLMVFWARRPMHFTKNARWTLILLAMFALCGGMPVANRLSRGQTAAVETAETKKHREGTRVTALVGTLREAGRRWSVTSEDGTVAYRVLENLSLERIAKAIQEDPQDRHWKLAGELTEFFGENYLLIDRVERAVRADSE